MNEGRRRERGAGIPLQREGPNNGGREGIRRVPDVEPVRRLPEVEAHERRRTVDDGRSIPDLLRELSQEGGELVRQEVALAKAELNQKVDTFKGASVSMAIGGGLLLAALLLFVQAVNHGLTALLAQAMSLEIAVWLAPLILAAVVGGIGWSVLSAGKKKIAEEGITPHETALSLKNDQLWAKRKAREVKEEIRNG